MARQEIFYVGRVVKTGFKQEDLISALLTSKPVILNDLVWTIVNSTLLIDENRNKPYIYGKLSKSKKLGSVTVLTNELNKEIEKEEPYLIDASSEFVYIPGFSGIIFRLNPGKIEPKQFIKWFNKIVEDTLGIIFVECSIKLIDDLRDFYQKIIKLDKITTLQSKVNPPNPLFGKFWEPLKNYLIGRNADEVVFKEVSKSGELFTRIKEILELLMNGTKEEIEDYINSNDISLVDTSILMSLDGYGDGNIIGKENNKMTKIKLHEKTLNFSIPKDHSIEDIYEKAVTIFSRINNERYMEH